MRMHYLHTKVIQELKKKFYNVPIIIIIRRDDYSRNACANSKETLYRGRQLRNKRSTTIFSRKRTRLIRACRNRQDRRSRSARDYSHHHYRSDSLSLHRAITVPAKSY